MEKAARGRLLRLSVNQAPSLRELSAEPTEGVLRCVKLLPSPLGDTSLKEGGITFHASTASNEPSSDGFLLFAILHGFYKRRLFHFTFGAYP